MRFGVYGCRHGHINDFIKEMLELGHEFLGIYETEPDIAKGLASKYNVPLFADGMELLKLKPDILGTSAVNNRKIDVIELCNKEGIHIMVDKPIITSRKACERLEAIINEGRIQIGMMLTERFNSPIYGLWKMIQEGKLGEIVSFTIMKPHKLLEKTRAPWHFSKEENGGIAIDLLIHDVDLLRWFTGSEVASCHGYIKKTGYPQYDTFYDSVNVLIKMENGVVANLEADWWMPDSYFTYGDGRIFCVGTKGRAEIRTTGDGETKGKPYGLWIRDKEGYERCEEVSVPITLTQDFINRIEGKGKAIISNHDVLMSSRAIIEIDESLEKIISI
ncbi:MAG: Gfo/Idh/MocA family oxidoreductase [Clostridiales bacterium]|jgi:predicted dehydrogenase|nr:Gfo/Idh/MocA family oxidoreductase [Clostridiales bacterium]